MNSSKTINLIYAGTENVIRDMVDDMLLNGSPIVHAKIAAMSHPNNSMEQITGKWYYHMYRDVLIVGNFSNVLSCELFFLNTKIIEFKHLANVAKDDLYGIGFGDTLNNVLSTLKFELLSQSYDKDSFEQSLEKVKKTMRSVKLIGKYAGNYLFSSHIMYGYSRHSVLIVATGVGGAHLEHMCIPDVIVANLNNILSDAAL